MSFDLYVIDAGVSSSDEVLALLDADEISETVDIPLTPKLAEFIGLLEAQFPGEDPDDFDESPWSSWPLTQSSGGGQACALNIRWSRAEDMAVLIHDLCVEHGLAFFDPQNETLVRPTDPINQGKPGLRGRWGFRRRS